MAWNLINIIFDMEGFHDQYFNEEYYTVANYDIDIKRLLRWTEMSIVLQWPHNLPYIFYIFDDIHNQAWHSFHTYYNSNLTSK